METTGIRENICQVNGRIRKACAVSGRKESDVTLIAVSKTKPLSMLQEAYACGCRHFGENKVQELVEKYDQMPKDVKWHMIGHLQRNKVKYIVDKVCLIHSVDSLRLAEEISKEALKKYGEDTVNAVGATWKQSDVFGYEVNIAKLEQIKAGG